MSIQNAGLPPVASPPEFSQAAGLLKAAADPHRLVILSMLAAEDEACVCDFTSALNLNQSTVSHHLRILRESGLVTSERRGTWVHYRISATARQLLHDAIHAALPSERAA